MSQGGLPERRLLIAAESLGGAEAALIFGRTILEGVPARPMGLIIEPDTAALQAGGTRRLVSTNGAFISIPPRDLLHRIAKADASALAKRLDTLATAFNLPWSCDLSAGDLIGKACATAQGEDILLLGQRSIWRRRGKILLVGTEQGASEASRQLAGALARVGSAIVSLCVPERQADLDGLIRHLDQSHVGAIVVDCDAGPVRTVVDLRRVFAAARCPVTALGASRVGRATAQAER